MGVSRGSRTTSGRRRSRQFCRADNRQMGILTVSGSGDASSLRWTNSSRSRLSAVTLAAVASRLLERPRVALLIHIDMISAIGS